MQAGCRILGREEKCKRFLRVHVIRMKGHLWNRVHDMAKIFEGMY